MFNHIFLFLLTIASTSLFIKLLGSNNGEDKKKTIFILLGIYLFYILFSIEVASIRDGLSTIAQPYQRTKYEYIGDIGITKGIFELFNRYHEIQPYLSLHGRLAPPGPLSLLWFCSYFIGKSPMPLSLFTILFGGLAIFPLFLWIKELLCNNTKIAIIGTFLYTIIPSLVLFCATSTEILYMPFLFLSLWTFEKSINKSSIPLVFVSGISFAVLSLFKFTLLSIGIYFLLRGIVCLYKKQQFLPRLILLSICMCIGFFSFYSILYLITGYKPIQVFLQAQKMFREDIQSLQIIAPRYSLWWFKLFTPLSWIYFTGIPILFGFLGQIRTKNLEEKFEVVLFLITLFILTIAYIAPGEGERSALYIFPFFLIPSLHFWRNHLTNTIGVIVLFLIFQTVLTEALFYTYW
ncbi:MAG: hypothetical protein ACP5UA_13445 [Candidatus Hydrogenedens sp.]